MEVLAVGQLKAIWCSRLLGKWHTHQVVAPETLYSTSRATSLAEFGLSKMSWASAACMWTKHAV